MVLIIILTVVFGAFLFILSMVYYVEQKEIRRIKRYCVLRKMGFEESARIVYIGSADWTR